MVYFSENDVIGDADDTRVGELNHDEALAPDTTYTETLTVTLPSGLDGSYYLYLITDMDNEAVESDETNQSKDEADQV